MRAASRDRRSGRATTWLGSSDSSTATVRSRCARRFSARSRTAPSGPTTSRTSSTRCDGSGSPCPRPRSPFSAMSSSRESRSLSPTSRALTTSSRRETTVTEEPKPTPPSKTRGPSRDVHARLVENLEYLSLTRLAQSYRDHVAQAAKGNQSHLDFLDAVLADEAAERFDRRVDRRIARARFPVEKTIEGFDWAHPSKVDRQRVLSLFDLDFLGKKRNALFVGGTGLGKTHLAISLGVAACRKGYNVLFRTAMEIVNELQAAQTDATFLKKLRFFSQPTLLVVDELGYLPIDKQGADLLFQV